MADNFKQATRVTNNQLLQQRMNLLGARQLYPAAKYGFGPRPGPTQAEVEAQHKQLAQQREDFLGARPVVPSSKGGLSRRKRRSGRSGRSRRRGMRRSMRKVRR